uniref:Uncharacterized protein n=1 Tax=Cacopsylla melanoneura TaxID=428564 RepID=A0A8D9E3K2_9HEMI
MEERKTATHSVYLLFHFLTLIPSSSLPAGSSLCFICSFLHFSSTIFYSLYSSLSQAKRGKAGSLSTAFISSFASLFSISPRLSSSSFPSRLLLLFPPSFFPLA